MDKLKDNIIIGLVEKISIIGKTKQKDVLAKIDTGATRSSIDTGLADELEIGPIIKSKLIKSVHGSRLRPVVEVEIKLANKKIRAEFTLADRLHMKYPALIGQNVLKMGFIIDPNK